MAIKGVVPILTGLFMLAVLCPTGSQGYNTLKGWLKYKLEMLENNLPKKIFKILI